jgi:hypothetical protein
MFCPTQLVVSVQGTFVLIDQVDGKNPQAVQHVPQELLADVRFGSRPVRTYNIVTPFTIEPYWKLELGGKADDSSPNQEIPWPIRGVMTTYGFMLPYPKQDHRFSVWFTGGSLEVASDGDDDKSQIDKWFQIFNDKKNNNNHNNTKRSMLESGKLVAAKILMGASTNDDDQLDPNTGKLSYTLTKPKASHIDLIYLDQKLQILRGSSGTVYVHVRIPSSHQAVFQAAAAASTHSQEVARSLPSSLPLHDAFSVSDLENDNDEDDDEDDEDRRDRPEEHYVMAIDTETQRKARALIDNGELKQATELLQRSHSLQATPTRIYHWKQLSRQVSLEDPKGANTPQHKGLFFRRTMSENNLHHDPLSSRIAVRPHGYALEA